MVRSGALVCKTEWFEISNRVIWYKEPCRLARPGALVLFFKECPGEPGALIYETGRFGTTAGWFGYEPGGLAYKIGFGYF